MEMPFFTFIRFSSNRRAIKALGTEHFVLIAIFKACFYFFN